MQQIWNSQAVQTFAIFHQSTEMLFVSLASKLKKKKKNLHDRNIIYPEFARQLLNVNKYKWNICCRF